MFKYVVLIIFTILYSHSVFAALQENLSRLARSLHQLEDLLSQAEAAEHAAITFLRQQGRMFPSTKAVEQFLKANNQWPEFENVQEQIRFVAQLREFVKYVGPERLKFKGKSLRQIRQILEDENKIFQNIDEAEEYLIDNGLSIDRFSASELFQLELILKQFVTKPPTPPHKKLKFKGKSLVELRNMLEQEQAYFTSYQQAKEYVEENGFRVQGLSQRDAVQLELILKSFVRSE